MFKLIRDALAYFVGYIVRYIYIGVSSIGQEPKNISFLSIAIVLSTILITIIIIPMTKKQVVQQIKTQKIQPELKEIQTKYKNQPELMNQKVRDLYKKHDFSMSAGCLSTLAIYPILLGFLWALRNPETYIFSNAAQFAAIAKNFLWVKDLTGFDVIYGLPLINVVIQIVMGITMMPKSEDAKNPMMGMMFVLPLIILFQYKMIPAGVFLYWAVSMLMNTVIRQIVTKKLKAEDAEKRVDKEAA